MATIYDIAKKASVSHTAVSDILNCGREHKYPEATIKKVRQVADEVGYRRNVVAGSLRMGKTKSIGITSNAQSLSPDFTNPFTAGIYKGVAQALAGKQVKVVFSFDGSGDIVNFAGSGMLDGLIFIMFSPIVKLYDQGALKEILDAIRIPMVCIHSLHEDIGYPSVGLDCVKGGYMACEHMIEHGYETIGFVGMQYAHGHTKDQYDSYLQAMIDHGREIRKEHIYLQERYGTTAGYELAGEMITSGTPLPRALVVVQDTLAYGMMMRFKEEGIRVPEDIAIMGFGAELEQKICATDLTSVTQPVLAKGLTATEMLLERLDGKGDPEENLKVLLPELVIRKSCGCNKRWSV